MTDIKAKFLYKEKEQKIPRQQEMVLATVRGKRFTDLPEDLYVPPNSLKILLDTFTGPLDLLLYLIRKQNIDILDINVLEITQQYTAYIDFMESMEIELAGDYLVMAAYLAELKSKMILPRHEEENEEDDPRSELIKRLQEYQRFKEAAEKIEELPRMDRDFFAAQAKLPEFAIEQQQADVPIEEIVVALSEVMRRAEQSKAHLINFEELSTRERMTEILEQMKKNSFLEFSSLFKPQEGKIGIVVTFLAILELLKDSLIEIVQSEEFGPIYIKGIEEIH
tara:strand:+ start:83053 stop:83892 length:840 start_codon:yes stop_codon:yes gene_type:complete